VVAEPRADPTALESLRADADDARLLAATVANHVDWMRRLARASGGTVGADPGLVWTDVARAERELTLAVTAAPDVAMRDRIRTLLAGYRTEPLERVGCWAASTDYLATLGAWLSAAGFRWGGRPHWMVLDLATVTGLPSMGQLSDETGMAVTDTFFPIADSELPCYHPDTVAVREATVTEQPRRVWHAVQWADGEPAGQVSICLTTGSDGVCGLHDTVVLPARRIKGVGIGRLLWVCRFAADLGYRYVVTNAADGNGPLFTVWGFRTIGFGQTWWLPGSALRADLPAETVAFAEAVGLGDLAALDALAAATPGAVDLDAPLPNGMTPLQVAGATGQRAAATWLERHGARPDVLAAWDLGLADRARELLSTVPGLLTAQRPRSGKTLLHSAVERDDLALVELLLAAGIDTSVRDSRFGGTALDWAHQLRRPRIAGAIRRHQAGPTPT